MKTLYLIPARGGSKGIPRKNIKLLNGEPLIKYSIDAARKVAPDADICVSTDDKEIIDVVESLGLKVPFTRPEKYATDSATSSDVALHALRFYESMGVNYDTIVMLQPTSPLRTAEHIKGALALYDNSLDMIVSVRESASAFIICKENSDGFLFLPLNTDFARRQDMPSYYEYNGAVYVMNSLELKKKGMAGFTKVKKYVMDDIASLDIDSQLDWNIVEMVMKDKQGHLSCRGGAQCTHCSSSI